MSKLMAAIDLEWTSYGNPAIQCCGDAIPLARGCGHPNLDDPNHVVDAILFQSHVWNLVLPWPGPGHPDHRRPPVHLGRGT